MTTRTTEEILRDITQLFTELTEAQVNEKGIIQSRISRLEDELDTQRQKQIDIANILLRG